MYPGEIKIQGLVRYRRIKSGGALQVLNPLLTHCVAQASLTQPKSSSLSFLGDGIADFCHSLSPVALCIYAFSKALHKC